MSAVTVVVAGGVNIDTTYRVANLPKVGETIFSSDTTMSLGGKGLNQAVAAQRAGAHVAILAAVGMDQAGVDIQNFAKQEGIETALLQQTSGANTGRAVIAVDSAAKNMIIVDSGANALATFSAEYMRLIDWSNVAYVVANGEVPLATISSLFEFAKRAGIVTAWNPSPVPSDPDPLLVLTDVVVLNETEATTITGNEEKPESLVRRISQRGPSEVVLTLGASGSFVFAGGVVQHVRAEVITPVDSTAAGDTFLGYYIANRAKSRTPFVSAENASAAAALCVQQLGAVNAIPIGREIQRELNT